VCLSLCGLFFEWWCVGLCCVLCGCVCVGFIMSGCVYVWVL
jgi:hypothetical protein